MSPTFQKIEKKNARKKKCIKNKNASKTKTHAMQTLANLRLLAELTCGDFTDMERMNIEKVLDNDNKKAVVELERINKTRKTTLRNQEKMEARRLKEQKMEQKMEARRLKENRRRRNLQIERALLVRNTLRYEENRQDYTNFIYFRFGFPLILNAEEENILYEMRETAMENIRLRDNESISQERINYLEKKPEDGNKECGICYDTKMCILNYKCMHSFCKKCLVIWSKSCPICRSE